MRIVLIKERVLFFGKNSKCLDPQVGLLNFGPMVETRLKSRLKFDSQRNYGTKRSIDKTKVWLDRLKFRINAEQKSKTEYKGIDFPGISVEGPFHFEIIIDDNC